MSATPYVRTVCVVLSLVVTSAAFSGCKTIPRNRTAWHNERLAVQGVSEQQRRTIFAGHQAECRYKAVQVAEGIYPSAPPPQQAQFSGRIDGRRVSGTVTTGGPPMYYSSVDALNAGARAGDKQRVIQDVFAGCMSELGWETIVVPR